MKEKRKAESYLRKLITEIQEKAHLAQWQIAEGCLTSQAQISRLGRDDRAAYYDLGKRIEAFYEQVIGPLPPYEITVSPITFPCRVCGRPVTAKKNDIKNLGGSEESG